MSKTTESSFAVGLVRWAMTFFVASACLAGIVWAWRYILQACA